jgi:RNA polymerase sigma factor (sigma-70 family)
MDGRPARPDARDDAQLVRAATGGDRGAFAAIYDRYADRLHDFCWGLLRDRDEAADATQDAFLVAAERLGQLRDPERLRPWLYAVARSQALRRIRARSREAPEEEMTDLPDPTTGPEQAAERSDLRQLVWSAAAGLSDRDRALLDLHLRHGLEGTELAQAMGIEPGHAYVLLSRLRDQVERSLGAFLVARLGRADCPDLSSMLSSWDGRFSPLVRKRVARHVDGCEVCGPARRRLASPLALLAAVPPMPAPAYLRGRVLGRIQLTGSSGNAGDGPGNGGPGSEAPGSEASGSGSAGPGSAGPGAAGSGAAGSGAAGSGAAGSEAAGSGAAGSGAAGPGTPGGLEPASPALGPPEGERSGPGEPRRSAVHSPLVGRPGASRGRRRGAVIALVAAMLVAVGVGVGLGWERSPAVSSPTDGQGGPIVAGPATSVATTVPPTTGPPTSVESSTTATTGATTTTAPSAPASLAAAPARLDLGAARTAAAVTVRNGGDEPLSWTADPSVPWLRVSPSSGRLDGGGQARLAVSATRDGLPEGGADGRIDLRWDGPARSVAVALRAERDPVIGGLSASPPQIFTGPCTPTTTLTEATVTDESPIASVTLNWGGRQVPMTRRSGRWFARLGLVPTPGTVAWTVVATDSRGNSASASGPPVRVLACP